MKDQIREPLVLALDTSTASLAAALVRGRETLGSVQSLAERNHSVETVSKLKALLDESGVPPDKLDGIVIGRGPGSYTGMRIAVSVGKTLAWAWNKPLVGVSSLESLAYGARQAHASQFAGNKATGRPDWFVPIMDARRGQVYTAAFASNAAGGWSRLAEDGVRLMHQWVDRLDEMSRDAAAGEEPARIWIIGDLTLHEAEGMRLQSISAEGGSKCEVRLQPFTMEGSSVAVLGAIRLEAGESDDVHSFVPNYTQLAEAEVKLLQKSREREANPDDGNRA
ncbi:tRNA (adenosine(37)-N6)-threonylcarbamoyltransferase complex dimerization subunit type 1 TsaB [Paenibacillus sp. sptzw28]|uniref:tRNA (adenosine(37)-N6)-threonylcarbamoyltransferase complex dimerization subunit type 1 TsaB n=1 Tax=Paenibacillus sp. sptzw28 TaxID=715179 RepID=UPI001C6F2508|nr:tRNA (adenosine(37)-N6)-threonylcarbamoyltransferase complex dimerization subunit type 1 TsaB [Paenibacillus sp. sptzw28]QYR20853.1 tRNA (adenosine(37)-N6)-threonylcarbamoyltransferase complex dimerization subunit type 1 TsaB [Paenibacillus sp. sptzw28]